MEISHGKIRNAKKSENTFLALLVNIQENIILTFLYRYNTYPLVSSNV